MAKTSALISVLDKIIRDKVIRTSMPIIPLSVGQYAIEGAATGDRLATVIFVVIFISHA